MSQQPMVVASGSSPDGRQKVEMDEENGMDRRSRHHPQNSNFVPLLPQIGCESAQSSRLTIGQRRRNWFGGAEEETNSRQMLGQRTTYTALFLALLFLSGMFALFEASDDRSSGDGDSSEVTLDEGDLTEDDVKKYLNRFGYVESDSQQQADQASNGQRVYAQQQHRTADQLLEDFPLESLKSAIRRFQEFAGLPTTGELDNRTKKKMQQPRCGLQDVQMLRGRGGDGVFKWRKRELTYRVEHFTSDLPNYMQKKALQMAFDAWSRHIPLAFSEASAHQQADIRVRFARRNHGDPWPFDGRGGVLAHATFPSDGQLHFDDDEQWAFMDGAKISSLRYTDLFWVSLHEIGHVLGLSHSKVETAIMAPFYRDPDEMVDWRGNYRTPELTGDDIRTAQGIYGAKSRTATNGPANGGSRNREHYDDNEGGFLSKLGKLFGGDDDEEEDDDSRRGHWGQRASAGSRNTGDGQQTGGRRTHSRREQQHTATDDADDEEESVLGGFFSSGSSPRHGILLSLSIPLLLAFLLI